MGGPASSTTTEIYLQAHELTAISTALHHPKLWERYVDSVYSVAKRTHLENFFHHIIIFIKKLSLLRRRKKWRTSVSWHFIQTE